MSIAEPNFNIDAKKLASYLENHVEGFRGPLAATKFSGGQSNPTYLIEADSKKYVLRRKPSGELLKSAHAVDREYRVMAALAATDVPVAKVYHLCEDSSVIGSIFYLMEFIDGRVFWDPALPEQRNEERTAIYHNMVAVLANLHSVDVSAVGLENYGRPGNYYERQIGRWTKQYRSAETGALADIDALIKWLPENMPVDDGQVVLAHGDFRLDNMMFHPTEPRVLALVDWELSTLGHPYADLSYQCMQWRMRSAGVMPGLGGVNREKLGIPSEDVYVETYCRLMNIDAIPNWNFYVVFSIFRFAAILQGVKKRALDGNASSDKALKMGALVQPLAAMACESLS